MVPEPRDRTTEVRVKWDSFIYGAAALRPVVHCSKSEYMFFAIPGVASSKPSRKTVTSSSAVTRRTLTFSVR